MRKRVKDYYYKRAKFEGYRSRAAYKLKQMNQKFNILNKGDIVVDLGAAPGGWIQVSREIVGEEGFIIGVDINPIRSFPWENIKIIQADITSPETIGKIRDLLPNGKANVVLSDAAPKISGAWDIDQANQIFIAENVLKIAIEVLDYNGICVIKAFQGNLFRDFIEKVKKHFEKVRIFKPQASRKSSAEVYIIARGRISQHQK